MAAIRSKLLQKCATLRPDEAVEIIFGLISVTISVFSVFSDKSFEFVVTISLSFSKIVLFWLT